MNKILATLALLLALSQSALAQQSAPLHPSQCVQHEPWGAAQHRQTATAICRTGYITYYLPAQKIPLYVAYTTNRTRALGCAPRRNDFEADKSVTDGPTPQDYTGTGYDRGHAAPNGDLSWHPQVQAESFLMTNMYPQAGSFNRGIWKNLETAVRAWVVDSGHTWTIYTGGVSSPGDKTIGRGVVVPHYFYKIVVNHNTGQAAGWAFPHRPPYPNLGTDLVPHRVPIGQIMEYSGVRFNFPPGVREIPPTHAMPYSVDRLNDTKRAVCVAQK